MKKKKLTILSLSILGLIVLAGVILFRGDFLVQSKTTPNALSSSEDQSTNKSLVSKQGSTGQNATPSSSGSIIEKKNIGIQIGQFAPDFKLQTLDGKTVHLSDYRGKKVILNFWATWCPPCKQEMPDMEQFYQTSKHKKVEILAVNLTGAEQSVTDVTQFVKKDHITFPVLLAKEMSIPTQFQAFSIPTSYIIDTKGVIRNKTVGPMTPSWMKEQITQIK